MLFFSCFAIKVRKDTKKQQNDLTNYIKCTRVKVNLSRQQQHRPVAIMIFLLQSEAVASSAIE